MERMERMERSTSRVLSFPTGVLLFGGVSFGPLASDVSSEEESGELFSVAHSFSSLSLFICTLNRAAKKEEGIQIKKGVRHQQRGSITSNRVCEGVYFVFL